MTSTIAPAIDTFMLARKDPALRLMDYKASLEFQIGLLKPNMIDAIVYADNSGFPLDQLRDICEKSGVSDRVEFLSYTSGISPRLSRYFLEINLLENAFAMSKILLADPQQRIWKLTGRYIVTNIEKIIHDAPDCDLYVNCRDYPEHVIDFYLTAFTRRGYTEILARDLENYKNTVAGEILLRKKIDTQSFPKCRIVRRFNHTPRISGVRGFDGARYGGWKDNAKYALRYSANLIAPSFWI